MMQEEEAVWVIAAKYVRGGSVLVGQAGCLAGGSCLGLAE